MPIVTDGLVGYWNSKQGVNGATWSNISPSTAGSYNGALVGALTQAEGMYFDGVDDYAVINTTPIFSSNSTLEVLFKPISSPTYYAIPFAGYLDTANRFEIGIGGGKIYAYSRTNDSAISKITNFSVVNNNTYHLVLRFYNGNVDIFINGAFNTTVAVNNTQQPKGKMYIGSSFFGSTTNDFFHGHVLYARVYNVGLSNEEINNNYLVGADVGLDAPSPPTVSSVVANRLKISDEVGVNQSIITVRFDTDVTQYVARLNGVDYNTGTLVHTGGAVAANTDATIIVDWNELTTEGSNRINVYGQNANGWTTQ